MIRKSNRQVWVVIAALIVSSSAAGMYCPEAGRFLQQDPIGYVDGLNLYEYARCSPIKNIDAMGLWGSDIHYQETSNWAEMVQYPQEAAHTVGSGDEGIDYGRTRPAPGVGDLSWHFNTNRAGEEDSRIVHYRIQLDLAKQACGSFDMPAEAAKNVGRALHPYQDWVAHGDYFEHMRYVESIHNQYSPQWEFGSPSDYPDNPALDAIESPDGRPAGQAIRLRRVVIRPPYGFPYEEYYQYAIYGPGIHRYLMTEQLTKRTLYEFREWVRVYGNCKCKKYFGITP
jgi:hypothetical protein